MSNITSMPKTDTFRFRINPEIREEIERIYSENGLTLTQAINIFIQQSINAGGLPFPVTSENAEFMRANSMKKLMQELDEGKDSGDTVDEDDVYKRLGVER